jgi:hypothetical protein
MQESIACSSATESIVSVKQSMHFRKPSQAVVCQERAQCKQQNELKI